MADGSFRMTIEDVFGIRNRGTVVTGFVEAGVVAVGDEVEIRREADILVAVVNGIEVFRRTVDEAAAGDTIGVLLRDVAKDQVHPGDVLSGTGKSVAR